MSKLFKNSSKVSSSQMECESNSEISQIIHNSRDKTKITSTPSKLRIRSSISKIRKPNKKTSKKQTREMREKIMEEIKQTSTIFKTTQDLKNKKCEICEIGKLTDKINNQLNNEMECQNYLHFKDDIIDCNKELFVDFIMNIFINLIEFVLFELLEYSKMFVSLKRMIVLLIVIIIRKSHNS